jgi:hypothetical protein
MNIVLTQQAREKFFFFAQGGDPWTGESAIDQDSETNDTPSCQGAIQ